METKAGDDKPLGRLCSQVRQSMKNNQVPVVTGLSENNFNRLEDIGFVIIDLAHLRNGSRNSKPTRQSTDTAT